MTEPEILKAKPAPPEFDPAAYEKYKIDTAAELMDNPVLLSIGDIVVATLGNFSLWVGKAKSRKTFLVTALASAAACGKCSIDAIKGIYRADADKVLYFDTEQSQFHAQRTIKRICKQIGILQPDNLTAYGLRPLSPHEQLQFIEYKTNNTTGLALVVIDGIADLLTNGINDEPEAIRLKAQLLKWTEERNIHIITVLHMNKADSNPRGVIGSYLMQKAEAIVTINKNPKDSSISIVHAEHCRDKDFEEFAFTINDEGLPVLTDRPQPEKPGLLQQKGTFEAILPSSRSMTRGMLVAEYMDRTGKSKRTADTHINAGIENQILAYDETTKGYKLFQLQVEEDPF